MKQSVGSNVRCCIAGSLP